MDIPEARFSIGHDPSPFGEPVFIEVYSREDSDSLGYLRESESLYEAKMRDPEKVLKEGDQEDYEFRFEIEDETIEKFESALDELIEDSRQEHPEPVEEALYTVTIYHAKEHGLEEELARYGAGDTPVELVKAFSSLNRIAYENSINSLGDED